MVAFPEQFDQSLVTIDSLAGSLSAHWMVIGGVSVASWGSPRATADIDVALSVSLDRAEEVDQRLTQHGWAKTGGPEQIKDTGIHLVRYAKDLGQGRILGLDIFFSMNDWQRAALGRRRRILFRDRPLWTASPEDLILYKLVADRGIDRDDVDNILSRRMVELDRPYVDAWSRTLGLHARWLEALTRFHDRNDLGG